MATYTNISNPSSVEEVKALLSAYLDKESVEKFFEFVNDYNAIVGETGLQGDFASFTKTEYDVEKSARFGLQNTAILSERTAASIRMRC